MRYAPIRAQVCPAAWFPFRMVRYREKQQKTLQLLIYFIELKFLPSVCANILVTQL